MLRYSFFLLSIWLAVAQSKAQYDPYYYNPYPYYPVDFKQSPVAYYPQGNRFFWNLFVSTSTTTTTCTKSTTACSGRRKRFIVGEMEEADAIQASAVEKVETTPLVEMGKRSDREANPQFGYVQGSPQGYPFYEVEPTFGQNYFVYSSPEQFYNRPPINVADPRWAIYTSTTTKTVTSTSTPSCSSSSNFNQC